MCSASLAAFIATSNGTLSPMGFSSKAERYFPDIDDNVVVLARLPVTGVYFGDGII